MSSALSVLRKAFVWVICLAWMVAQASASVPEWVPRLETEVFSKKCLDGGFSPEERRSLPPGTFVNVSRNLTLALSGCCWSAQELPTLIAKFILEEAVGLHVSSYSAGDVFPSFLALVGCGDSELSTCTDHRVNDPTAHVSLGAFYMSNLEEARNAYLSTEAGGPGKDAALNIASLGPIGFSTKSAAFVMDEVVKDAWNGSKIDLRWATHLGDPVAPLYFTPKKDLDFSGGVYQKCVDYYDDYYDYEAAEYSGPLLERGFLCNKSLVGNDPWRNLAGEFPKGLVPSNDCSKSPVPSGLMLEGWKCFFDGWWASPACQKLGDVARRCIVFADRGEGGGWSDNVVRAWEEQGIPILYIHTGMWYVHDLLVQNYKVKSNRLLFSWWFPDATVVLKGAGASGEHPHVVNPKKVNYLPGRGPAGTFAAKIIRKELITAVPEAVKVLEQFEIPQVVADELDEKLKDYVVEHSLAFGMPQEEAYFNVSCDWVRKNRDVWGTWLLTAVQCPSGTTWAEKRQACDKCPPGKTALSGVPCYNCSAGKFCPLAGTAEPASCPKGRFCMEASVEPQRCDPGTANSKEDGVDRNSCEQCKPGKHAAKFGASDCDHCDRGLFASHNGSVKCDVCPVGKYVNIVGASICIPCPLDTLTTPARGSPSIGQCVCKQGYFHECGAKAWDMECALDPAENFTEHFCKACPPGMECNGVAQSPLAMVNEYTPSDTQSLVLLHRRPMVPRTFMAIGQLTYRCPGEGNACPGALMDSSEDVMCTGGTKGVACAMCPENTELRGNTCVGCAGSTLTLSLFFVLLISGTAIFIKNTIPPERGGVYTHESVLNKINSSVTGVATARILGMVQYFWILSKLSVEVPENPVKITLSSGGDVLDLSSFKLGCLPSVSAREFAVLKSMVLNSAPGTLLVFGLILVLVAWAFPARRQNSRYWPGVPETCSAVLAVFTSFFVMISDFAVNKGFATSLHPCGDRSLRAFPFLLVEDTETQIIMAASVVGICLWVVGGISVVITIMIQLKGSRGKDLSFRRGTAALTVAFRHQCPWWSLVVLVQNLLVAAAIVLFEGAEGQLVWISMVILLYTVLLARVQPYYAYFAFECDFFTSLLKGILILMYPLATGGFSKWVVTGIAFFTYAISFVFLVLAVLCSRVQHHNLQAANRDGPVIDWQIAGKIFIDRFAKAFPCTMDWTEVAILTNMELGTDFKPYSEISYMTRRRERLSLSSELVDVGKEANRDPNAQEQPQVVNAVEPCVHTVWEGTPANEGSAVEGAACDGVQGECAKASTSKGGIGEGGSGSEDCTSEDCTRV